MSFLVDTCALSELTKPWPSPPVVDWFQAARPEDLFASSLTFGEIRKGVEMLAPGRRRTRIAAWLETELSDWFEGRVLPVSVDVADEWGRLTARVPGLPVVDGLIGATALHHGLALVTRNETHFAKAGVKIVNPWPKSA